MSSALLHIDVAVILKAFVGFTCVWKCIRNNNYDYEMIPGGDTEAVVSVTIRKKAVPINMRNIKIAGRVSICFKYYSIFQHYK